MRKSFIDMLSQNEKFESGTPATLDSIKKAEDELSLAFSDEYREYLLKYGCASFIGHIFTGISRYPGVSVVSVTEDARLYNPQVSGEFYVIEETHMDGVVIWQKASGEIYQSAPGSGFVKICDSLLEYIEKFA